MKKAIYFLFFIALALVSCEDVTEIYEENTAVQLDVSTSYVVFGSDGGMKTVLVASNKSWTWSSDGTWFSVSPGEGLLEITAPANGSSTARYGEVTVTVTDEFGVYDETISVAQQMDAKGAIDLSANETANCYIANTNTTYRFNATVKGNGANTEGGPEVYIEAYGATITPSDIIYAALLWEAVFDADLTRSCNIIDGIPVYKDGYVYFTTGYAEGNAVIAVKDSYGDILWSWHIWVTDAGFNEVEGGGFYWMDRNLGAISAEPADINNRGLLYQWGRKDPFLPSSAQYGASTKNVPNTEVGDGTGEWNYGVTTQFATEAPGNISYSIKKPMNVLLSKSNVYAWYLTDSNADLRKSYLWGNSDDLDTVTKSIFDPCPAGYNIPVTKAWTSGDDSQWSYQSGDYGFRWVTGNDAFYPMAGSINGTTGVFQNDMTYGYYWTTGRYLDTSYYSMYLYFNSSNVRYTYTYPCHAYSVRCMKAN